MVGGRGETMHPGILSILGYLGQSWEVLVGGKGAHASILEYFVRIAISAVSKENVVVFNIE